MNVSGPVVGVAAKDRDRVLDPDRARTRNLIEEDRDVLRVFLITALQEKEFFNMNFNSTFLRVMYTKLKKYICLAFGSCPTNSGEILSKVRC